MAELKPSDGPDSFAAPFAAGTTDRSASTPPARGGRYLDRLLDSPGQGEAGEGEDASPSREGLPASYRMRHDAHYVDELESRTRRQATAPVRVPAPAGGDAAMENLSRAHVALALTELCRSLDGLSSCFNLVPAGARPLRERLGLELAHVETRRAWRTAQGLKLLLDDPPMARQHVNLGDLLRQVVVNMSDELRLVRVNLGLDVTATVPGIQMDEGVLSLGIASLLGALVATIEASPEPGTLHATTTAVNGSVSLRVHARHALPPGQLARLFDLAWVDRPGGVAAAVGLAAARRVTQLHGGHIEASVHQSGGFVVSLTVPMEN